jgi:Fe-S-cluster containining protein
MITCDKCPDSACCRDVTVEIDEPETLEEWDEIRWMVAHKNVAVYVDEDDDWVVVFKTDCNKLDEKGKCTTYNTRPQKCKDHPMDSCVYNGEGDLEKIRFDTMDQVEQYVKKEILPDKKKELQKELAQIDVWPTKKD